MIGATAAPNQPLPITVFKPDGETNEQNMIQFLSEWRLEIQFDRNERAVVKVDDQGKSIESKVGQYRKPTESRGAAHTFASATMPKVSAIRKTLENGMIGTVLVQNGSINKDEYPGTMD